MKRKPVRRLVSMLLSLLMLLGVASIGASAAVEYTYGDYTFELDAASKATIVAFPETKGGSIVIPSSFGSYPVVAIGEYAFYGCTTLASVEIPSSVTRIDRYAFAFCTSLTSVKIPASVTSIGVNVFQQSTKVKIYAPAGSAAATYAAANGIPCDTSGGGEVPTIPPPAVLQNKWIWFDTATNESYSHASIDFSDRLFNNSASSYNHELALAGSALAAAAYKKNQVYDGMNEELLFKNIKQYNYETDGSGDQVAYSFGVKQITCGGERYNLFAIIVRGTSGKEWYSNFNLGRGDYHSGFTLATQKLYSDFQNYITIYRDYLYKNKIFITGHSRGAAVANLTAAILTDDLTYASKNDIYAYTFATPNVTRASEAKNTAKYSNIWNFVNPEDFVPYMPLPVSGWNYWKFGKTIAFKSWDKAAISKLNTKFKAITGNDFNNYEFSGYGAVQSLAENLHKLAKTPADYYDNKPYIVAFNTNYSPYNFFYNLAEILSEDVWDWLSIPFLVALRLSWHYGSIAGFFIANGTGNAKYAHAQESYVAWIQSTDASIQYSTNKYGSYARIACPVDVEVYDGTTLVGRIVNDVVDESLPASLSLTVIDDEKYISLPPEGNYSLKIIGTDTGTMDYTLQEVDVLTMQVTAEKSFNNVVLEIGKKFSSEINGDVATSDVKLLVLDANGTPVSEVLTNGTEQSLSTPAISKWWQSLPSFLQWILRYLLFGFIWM